MGKYFLSVLVLMSILTYPLLSQNFLEPLNDRYALVVGISNYKDSSHNLRFSAKDATDMYNAVATYGRFKKENVRILTDSSASRENIRRNIEGWLQKNSKKDDIVFIYFSGHGSQGEDFDKDEDDGYDEFLIPFDFESDDYSTAISDDAFAIWIKNLKSEKIFLALDCCFSGGAAKQKGFLPEGVKTTIIKDDFTSELPKTGSCLLAASRSDQVSEESYELQNGVFTYFLLKAITDEFDLNMDRIINEQELFQYIYDNSKDYNQDPLLLNSLQETLDIFYLVPIQIKSKEINEVEDLKRKINYLNESTKYKRSISDYLNLVTLLEQYLKLEPNNITTLLDLSNCYEYLNDFTKAAYYYELINSIDKTKIIPKKLSEVNLKAKNCKRALEIINDQIFKDSSVTNLNLLAEINICLGDTTKALSNHLNSYNKDFYNKNTGLALFYLYYTKSEYDNAYKIINNIYEFNFNDHEVMYWKGYFEKFYKNSVIGDSLLNIFYNKNQFDLMLLDVSLKNSSDISYKLFDSGNEASDNNRNKLFAKYYYYPYLHKRMILRAKERNDQNLLTESIRRYIIYEKLNIDQQLIYVK